MLRYPKLLALAAGALSATGFAPLELWPVTLACFALLIHLLWTADGWRGVFVRGWLFGVAHFTVGLNWIAHAFTYQDAMPHWFGYGAVVALSLYLAVFPAMGGMAAFLLDRSSRALRLPAKAGAQDKLHPDGMKLRDANSEQADTRPSTSLVTSEMGFVLLFAAAWIATEWLRATLFTGFAWNPLAAIWAPVYAGRNLTTLVGTYGLGGLTILLSAVVLHVAVQRTWASLGLLALWLGLLLIPSPPPETSSDQRVRIVQPNVGQDEKHMPGSEITSLMKLARLSGPPGSSPRILLWPEAAIDNGLLLEEEPGLRRFLARTLGPADTLLTGGIALEYDRSGEAIGARNSVFALGPDASVRARYDKAHLVPYGEYLPMRAILTPIGLSRLVPGDLDFWPGPGPKSFNIPGVGLVGFQVCYEIIFSGQVIDPARRPRFLFNPSNDAWFGNWGPPQHLAQARIRAIEEGMTIVRATPTGISGLIDPDGRLIARIGPGIAQAIDVALPEVRQPPPFARFGNLLPAILALGLAGLGVVIRLRAR